jgi:hypothetical protein
MSKRRRGRPLGFRLSEESKRQISESKKGQKHKQETKDKISRTLMLYFRRQHPVSQEIISRYCRSTDDDLCKWANDVSEELDTFEDIKTERAMNNIRKTEILYGQNIEYFSHMLTPEVILLLKEQCQLNGIDYEGLIK